MEAEMERMIKAFDLAAPSYESWYTTPLGTYVLEAETSALSQLLPKSGLGAEIGAGTGIFAKRLSNTERSILCIEPSVDMTLQLAKKRIPAVISLAEKPPIRATCLDFVYLVTVAEFLTDPSFAFHSLRTLLRKKAALIVLAINRKSPWGEDYQKAGMKTHSVFRYSTLYTPQELTQILEHGGYRVERCLMALETAPDSIPNSKPRTYQYEALPSAGVFILKAIPKENSGERTDLPTDARTKDKTAGE